VKRDIYVEYAKASNLGAVAVYLVMMLGAQTAQIGTLHMLSELGCGDARAENFALLPMRRVGEQTLTHTCIGGSWWLKDWSGV
jgi:hypothetical protein